MEKFEIGDIVSVEGEPMKEGEVVEVGDYIGVRMPHSGTTFSYWPQELVATGKRIRPDRLRAVNVMTRALEDAERNARSLRKLRDMYVLESIVAREGEK